MGDRVRLRRYGASYALRQGAVPRLCSVELCCYRRSVSERRPAEGEERLDAEVLAAPTEGASDEQDALPVARTKRSVKRVPTAVRPWFDALVDDARNGATDEELVQLASVKQPKGTRRRDAVADARRIVLLERLIRGAPTWYTIGAALVLLGVVRGGISLSGAVVIGVTYFRRQRRTEERAQIYLSYGP